MMDGREHSWYEELIPAYALDAVDDSERRAMDAHLKVCPPCRARISKYGELHEALLYSAEPVAARAGLTEELRKRLRSGSAPAERKPFWAVLLQPRVALGLALVLLIATNAYWAGRSTRAESQVATLAQLTQAPGIVLDPAADSSHASGIVYAQASARVALLCVYDLPTLEPGSIYQAWLIRGDQRVSGGTFRVDEAGYGVLLIQAAAPLGEFEGLGITVEPAGGSPAPTTPRVMGGTL